MNQIIKKIKINQTKLKKKIHKIKKKNIMNLTFQKEFYEQ